jgi:hypothetical protein
MEGLGVGINGYELDVLDPSLDHAVDGSTAGTADANYFNLGKRFDSWLNNLWHFIPSLVTK